MLKRNPYLFNLLIWAVEFVMLIGIGLILRDPIDRLPQTINLGIIVLPTQWTVSIILVLLVVTLFRRADHTLRTWLMKRSWLEDRSSGRE